MPTPKNIQQRGATMIVGIVLLVVIILLAIFFAYSALTAKSQPTLQVQAPKVTADDQLTSGKSNNELIIDTQIVQAGVNRDEDQRKAADSLLNDAAQAVGDGVTTSTNVEAERLSKMQTEYISEVDRRLGELQKASNKVDKLDPKQKPTVNKTIDDETTTLTGLKAKAAAETTKEAFLTDRDALDAEYVNYGLAIAQPSLLMWSNDQTKLDEKVNVLGGKFQERLDSASNNGNGTAAGQTLLNTYQSSKTLAKDGTPKAMQLILGVKPNSFQANRQVLKGYYSQLASVHNELDKATDTAKLLVKEIRTYK
jgi:hypothetical protein